MAGSEDAQCVLRLSQKRRLLTTFLAFTRTLTVLYSMTLLTLFSHVQLAVLNRIKYVQSVHQLEREARDREAPSSAPISIPGASLPGVAQIARWLQREDVLPDADEPPTMGPETELKYLTLSWWLLHVGWKDVGERVRRAVEEVFDE
jgi:peroxin-3